VAPVLDWCSRMLLFPATPEGGEPEEICASELTPWERLQLLQTKGVHTLICGALSANLQHWATDLGITVIHGVAGEVGKVVTGYRENHLNQPEFWLPGCQGNRRYRQGLGQNERLASIEKQGGKQAMPRGMGGRGAGRGMGGSPGGRCRRAAGGPGRIGVSQGAGMIDVCVCPSCGAQAPHEFGIPCLQVKCPQCGKTMVRS
jgi:predicted Fe-Mo cluster-binding NifX family protein